MMLVKKYPSIINMTIKIDKASLGAASDAGDARACIRDGWESDRKRLKALSKFLEIFRHKQRPAPGRAGFGNG